MPSNQQSAIYVPGSRQLLISHGTTFENGVGKDQEKEDLNIFLDVISLRSKRYGSSFAAGCGRGSACSG